MSGRRGLWGSVSWGSDAAREPSVWGGRGRVRCSRIFGIGTRSWSASPPSVRAASQGESSLPLVIPSLLPLLHLEQLLHLATHRLDHVRNPARVIPGEPAVLAEDDEARETRLVEGGEGIVDGVQEDGKVEL